MVLFRNRFGCWLCSKHAAEGESEEEDEKEKLWEDLNHMRAQLNLAEQEKQRTESRIRKLEETIKRLQQEK